MESKEQTAPAAQYSSNVDGDKLTEFKDYLSEPRFRIKLDDLVNATVRATLPKLSAEEYPLRTGAVSGDDFIGRLRRYEEAIRPLQAMAVLLGRWATLDQRPTLTNMLDRMSDTCLNDTNGGLMVWHGLRWYPLSLLMYLAGIAALSVENYATFAAVHTKLIGARMRRGEPSAVQIIVPVVDGM